MDAAALPFVWNGEAMVPPPGFARRCDEAYAIGQRYVLAEVQERSSQTHRHYFALVREAWMNLPEAEAARFPTADALRKYALIRAGYCDAQQTVCKFKTEARRLAETISAQVRDDYVLVSVDEKVVTTYRAKSQDMRSMDRATFQAAKDAVLGVLADMIGVHPTELTRRAEAA